MDINNLFDGIAEAFRRYQQIRGQVLQVFDNLLIQRKRMKALFGFDYQIECYVPAASSTCRELPLPILNLCCKLQSIAWLNKIGECRTGCQIVTQALKALAEPHVPQKVL